MSSHRHIPPTPTDLDRRAAIKWMIAAAGSAWLSTQVRGAVTQAAPPQTAPSSVSGYGLDANLTKLYHGGEFWPLILSAEQLRLAAVISDLLIPADEISPSASAVGVHHFLNEWVSAPYPAHLEDRTLLLDGFAWLDQRSSQLFGKPFVEIDDASRRNRGE